MVRARGTLPAVPTALRLFAAALVIGLAFQGSRALWEPDEGRYTAVAHTMIETGDWWVPRLDPEHPHLTKPPLTYWAVAASFELLGSHEWAARLPNALAFAAAAVAVFVIAQGLALPSPWLASGLWMTLLGPVGAANVVTTDTLLTLWETLAVAGFVSSGALSASGPRLRRGGITVMWLGFALAFLTKGPPGLLPLAAIVVWSLWRRRDLLPTLLQPLGLVLFATLGLGWYIALVLNDSQLLHYFLVHETVERVASAEFDRNSGPWGWLVAYGPMLLAGSMPWLLVIPALRARAAAPAGRPLQLTADTRRFLALWILLPLAVLVASRSRMPLYVLPGFVPIALVMASQVPAPARLRAWIAGIAAAAILGIGIKAVFAGLPSSKDGRQLAEELRATADLQAIDEIVFVDARAKYTLRHYLGIDVEQAESEPAFLRARGYVPPDDLCTELAEPRRAIIIVPRSRLDAVAPYFGRCGGRLTALGPLRDWQLFAKSP